MKFFKPLTLLATCASVLLFAPTAQAGLVALYSYDTAGNLGHDSSGKGNDLVADGTPASVAGKYGNALGLNHGSILTSLNGTLIGLPTGDASYTIATWINPDAYNSGGMVGWGNYGTQNEVNAFRMDGSYQVHNYWWYNDLTGGSNVDLTTGSGIDGWHYAAATYDAKTGIQVIYLDGNLVNSRTASGLNVQATNFAVGKTVGNEYFLGQLDDTAIFDQALTAEQLRNTMAGNFSGFIVNDVPEPASWALLLAGLGLLGFSLRRNGA